MVKLIHRSEYKIMPWKNGQGTTMEIAIDPADAKFPHDTFTWRFSSAKIQGGNTFSTFSGYQRILCVWKGQGLMLNSKKLLPFQPFLFSGDEQIECQPLGPKVTDLGIIYDAKKVHAEFGVHTLSPGDAKISLRGHVHFLVCIDGQFVTENWIVKIDDIAKIEDQNELLILCKTKVSFLQFTIRPV